MKFKFLFVFFLLFASLISNAEEPIVGVYYFPGWGASGRGDNIPAWEKIKAYPNREPSIGWYDGDDEQVLKSQLDTMTHYGINLVVFDWYWEHGKPKYTAPIENFKKLNNNSSAPIRYSILWANHADGFSSLSDFDVIVKYWVEQYLSGRNFYIYHGKPVVFLFSPAGFERAAKKIGTTAAELIERSQIIAQDAGLKGISWFGVSHAVDQYVNKYMISAGYSGVTAYNYHFGLSGVYDATKNYRFSHSYKELVDAYETTWQWFSDNSKLPYLIPLTVGWDKRPWGGSADPQHDFSSGDPEIFLNHVLQAKKILSKKSASIINGVIICCWNEYGEGSILEPTIQYGDKYLKSLSIIGR